MTNRLHVNSDLNRPGCYVPAGDYVYQGTVTIGDAHYHHLSDDDDATSDSLNFMLDDDDLVALDVDFETIAA